jgi:hypothetical protein
MRDGAWLPHVARGRLLWSDHMSICPNCAIPVRDGARFCTSCGARIDGEPVAYVPPSAPQFAPAWDEQPASPAAPAWPAPPAPNTWPGQEQPWSQPGDAWGSGWKPAEDLPFDPVAHAAIHGNVSEDLWATAEQVEVAIEAVDVESLEAVASVEAIESVEIAAIPAESAPPIWPESPALLDDELGGELVETSFVAEEPALPPVVTPLAASYVASYAAAPVAVADAVAARERAAAILTELRDLLPRLANPSGADPVTLAAVLESGIATDRQRWSALREVMEAARDRPRDVETVLALSQQVDAVIALIDRHDQLTDAVQRAARQLRGNA